MCHILRRILVAAQHTLACSLRHHCHLTFDAFAVQTLGSWVWGFEHSEINGLNNAKKSGTGRNGTRQGGVGDNGSAQRTTGVMDMMVWSRGAGFNDGLMALGGCQVLASTTTLLGGTSGAQDSAFCHVGSKVQVSWPCSLTRPYHRDYYRNYRIYVWKLLGTLCILLPVQPDGCLQPR